MRGGRTRGLHKRAEERRSKGITLHALWMPLHTDDPMFMRLMLDGFDHAVGSNRRNAQAAPKVTDGLMMGSVHLHVESAGTIPEAASCRELSELAT